LLNCFLASGFFGTRIINDELSPKSDKHNLTTLFFKASVLSSRVVAFECLLLCKKEEGAVGAFVSRKAAKRCLIGVALKKDKFKSAASRSGAQLLLVSFTKRSSRIDSQLIWRQIQNTGSLYLPPQICFLAHRLKKRLVYY
jgi:hypothetical protein